MRRLLFSGFILAVATIVSCGSDDTAAGGGSGSGSTPEFESTQIAVSMEASAEEFGGGDFSWLSGDKFSLIYSLDTSASLTAQFTAQSGGTAVSFSGTIWSWEGTKSLYALYSRGESIDGFATASGEVELYLEDLGDSAASFASTGDISAREMGVMVGCSEGASASEANSYSISPFSLKQVASLFQIQLTGSQPEDRNVTQVALKATSDQSTPFTAEAELSMASGAVVTSLAKCSSIECTVEDGESTSGRYLTMPLFPATISESLTLDITAEGVGDKVGWKWSYSYEIGSLSFERNTINSLSLSWSGDLTESVLTSVITASSLSELASSNEIPEGDTWVITTEEITTTKEQEQLLSDLSAILSSGTAETASITVELPGVTSIPENTFSGDSTDGNSNDALAAVTLSSVEEVGTAAFKDNTSVKEVTLGDGESNVTLSESVFEGCTSLETCQVTTDNLPAATFKGCSSLRDVSLSTVKSIRESAFEECSSLFTDSSSSSTLLTLSRSTRASSASSSVELVLIAVEEIDERAFFGCTQFDVIRLNESSSTVVTSIADDAFSYLNGNSEQSYTPNITLYLSSAMSPYANLKANTLTVGSTTLYFAKIYVDGVGYEEEEVEPDDDDSESEGATGEDANIENI